MKSQAVDLAFRPSRAGKSLIRNLGCWPEFPILISYHFPSSSDDDDVIALLLKHPDRVHYVSVSITISQFEKVAAAMWGPFQSLVQLELDILMMGLQPILCRGFLDGTAPYLQKVLLSGVQIPEFPKFLSSSRYLVSL
jgi:hypothetical protein